MKKQRKANVILNLGTGKNQVTCKGLIDTGNTITEETAIEEELHKQLQVGFQSTGGKPIGTANKQCKLTKLGVSNPIPIHIQGIGRFEVKPAVIRNLSDPFNIGNGFLESIGKQIPTSLNFEGQSVVFRVGSNQTELMRPMSENQEADGQTPTELQDHRPPQREFDVTSRRKMSRTSVRNVRDRGLPENSQSRLQKKEYAAPTR